MCLQVSKLPFGLAKNISVVHFSVTKPANLPFHLLTWGQSFVQRLNCDLKQRTLDVNTTFEEDLFDICGHKIRNMMHVNVLSESNTNITLDIPIKYVYYSENDQILKFSTPEVFAALSAATSETTLFAGRRKAKSLTSDPKDYMGSLDQWRECCAKGYVLDWPASPLVQSLSALLNTSNAHTGNRSGGNGSIPVSISSNISSKGIIGGEIPLPIPHKTRHRNNRSELSEHKHDARKHKIRKRDKELDLSSD